MSFRGFGGKAALVTGAASGIGEASAIRLAEEGASVVVTDIDDDGAARVAAIIGAAGGSAVAARLDVSAAADWAAAAELVAARFGRLDILHSNAYIEVEAPVHELAESDWDRQLAVSLKGTFLGMKMFAAQLTQAGGSVVITSSVHALLGFPGRPAYAAAKGGLTALGRQLAVDYGPEVRVNVVLPGPILTPAWDPSDQAAIAAAAAKTLTKRLGSPHEVAAAVAFLASDEASYITGASLVVDGGWSVAKETE